MSRRRLEVVSGRAALAIAAPLVALGVQDGSPHDSFDPDWTGFRLSLACTCLGFVGLVALIGSVFVSGDRHDDVRLTERDSTDT